MTEGPGGSARLSRRGAIGVIAGGAVGLWGAGCARRASAAGEVVLYSSADDFVLREVVAVFERESGITVRVLGDTEATKTTGLLERLVSEREKPVADVWWSSEPFGTIRLAGMGLFEPVGLDVPGAVDPALAGTIDAPDGSWFGFAARARVMGVREGRFGEEELPRGLDDLTDGRFEGRVGMARPRFGTTRGQMAAVVATRGEGALRGWLEAMKANRLRIYDGNSSVVRAVADAEIDIGLTDTDDVWAARRNGWPVGAVFESPAGGVGASLPGPMLMPNTVARVRGGPNAEQARALMAFLLAGRGEEILASSDSHNLPLRHAPFPDLEGYGVPGAWLPDLSAVAAADGAAMSVCERVLGG